MATITPTFAKGRDGNVTVVAGLDDSYTFQIKVGAFRLRFDNKLQDVSGYGDGGDSKYEDTRRRGSFVIAGWVITNGEVDPADLGSEISSANFQLSGDTAKYVGNCKIEQFDIDHKYMENTPVQLSGRFHGAVTAYPPATV